MAIEILMPALSPTMEEGTLSKWFISVGDNVSPGDLLAEIETDKATMELEAVDEGIVSKIIFKEGTESIKINTPIAVISEDNEEVPKTTQPLKNEASKKAIDEEKIIEQISKEGPKTTQRETVKNKIKELAFETGIPEEKKVERIKVTPLAKRLATENRIDLENIKGSGPKGRITKVDIERAVTGTEPFEPMFSNTEISLDKASKDKFANNRFELIPLNNMRKIIGGRLTESISTIPHFYLRQDIEIDKLIAMRSTINESLKEQNIKLTINDFIIKACAIALKQVPEANVTWADSNIKKYLASDISVAVSIKGGIITPVVFDADSKRISVISNEMKILAEKAKNMKLTPDEYNGGCLSISNLGMFGIDNFDAIINPPQSAILAVGAGIKRPKFDTSENEIKLTTIMKVTLGVDHRVIDGALGSKLLNNIKLNLENPEIMLA